MTLRALWAAIAVLYYAAIFIVQYWKPSLFQATLQTGWMQSFRWVYGFVFVGFGIVLQGAIARVFSESSSTIWRPLMLCFGASLALFHIWFMQLTAGIAMSVDMWLSALLGLAVAAVLARVLPPAVVLRWYGVAK